MKTTFEILQETIKTARELGRLYDEEKRLRNTPISIPEIRGEGEGVELQVRLASIKAEREREQDLHQLQLRSHGCSEKLNAFLWLFEDSKLGKS